MWNKISRCKYLDCPICHSTITDPESKYCPKCLTLIDKNQDQNSVKKKFISQPKKFKIMHVIGPILFLLIIFLIIWCLTFFVSPNDCNPIFNPFVCVKQQYDNSHGVLINPNAFRTEVPTPIPTPTVKPPPKFVRGDIVTDEQVTTDTKSLYMVLDYDSNSDWYHVSHIYRNDDGSWGHWTLLSKDFYFPRDSFEKGEWVYGHIDPNQVQCGELNDDPDSVQFCSKP